MNIDTEAVMIKIPIDAILETKRLILRYPQLSDAQEIYSVVQSPRFPDQLPLKEMNAISEVEGWLKRLQANWAAGRVYSWIVEARDTGKLSGQVTISSPTGDRIWALAFWTHPDDWGKGYATEGAKRVLAFGFGELGASKIWAGAGLWNKGSMRVLEKIGMQYRRDNPQGYTSKGKPVATREYEIVL